MRSMNRDRVVIMVGPTAVGKTALAIQIAQAINAEIISADSRLLYRGMDIGTAKPTPDERSLVPHHFIDVTDIDKPWSLAQYLEEVKEVVNDIHAKGKLPMLVGGTGQYIRAFIEGWKIPAIPPDVGLREKIERWGKDIGTQNLYMKLKIIDPVAAQHIEPNNLRRIVRAFEVIFSTGILFSEEKRSEPIDFIYKIIGLTREREELYKRIDLRIEKMFKNGLVEEVQKILSGGFSQDAPALSAIGYKQVIQLINDEIDEQEAKRIMRRKTRQYVRTQANWFKPDDPRIRWFEINVGTADEIVDYVLSDEGWHDGK